ncbi:hypothetical protein ACFUIT_10410 [Streptomyces sp. NPDC057239]|uniref:hypothetical protein n=1 Tax=Streptomyces sp. NPDC057239 TaxID=3346061 RepID=UPI003639E6DC
MRKNRQALSDAEITRRAAVNPQYLQRHRDLKAEAETVRAHFAQDRPRAAAAAAARQAETAMKALRNVNQRLIVENSRLISADCPQPTQTSATVFVRAPPTV